MKRISGIEYHCYFDKDPTYRSSHMKVFCKQAVLQKPFFSEVTILDKIFDQK